MTALLDFPTPTGLRFTLSSLSTPTFATSYTLRSLGLVDGSLSFLYSSLPLSIPSATSSLPLSRLVPGYRLLHAPHSQPPHHHAPRRKPPALLYGRLFLPKSTLEALYLRRLTPHTQLKLSCVSDSRLPNGGTVLALLQHDTGRYSTEYLYSTDSALLGIRGLYNFGTSPSPTPSVPRTGGREEDAKAALLSLGLEAYFSPLNKSGGLSTGLRFCTLPPHTGFPYTMALTLNPLMGSLSTTYSVRASRLLALSSRFDFNVYSYESELVVGMELWRAGEGGEGLEWARRKMGVETGGGEMAGVVKGRVDQRGNVGVVWEGRWKEFLYCCGVNLDLRGGENMVRGVGVELSFSS